MSHAYRTFEEVLLHDSTVNYGSRMGLPLKQIIVQLVNEKNRQAECIAELGAIVPKKITHAGQTYVWHCPEHLIPETK